MKRNLFFILMTAMIACSMTSDRAESSERETEVLITEDSSVHVEEILVGAALMDQYVDRLIQEKSRVAVTANQTSMVGDVHLVDTLLARGVNIVKVFALEHGFRGKVQAGEAIKNGKDSKTGLPIVSLYGNNKKPKPEVLKDIDVILFDIQDVGARFYTYISSMSYIMEAAAENDKQVIVLDRPNPNGHFVDGPVLKKEFSSFVGMHEVPIVHGMTIGEYAQMVNGEGWLKNGVKCNLQVVKCSGYDHGKEYVLPIAPSPNLPNMSSIYLYPSLCLFEGTHVSVGRGTDKPFQQIGMPGFSKGDAVFTPKSVEAAKNPPHMNKECRGYDLSGYGKDSMRLLGRLEIKWLLDFYTNCPDKSSFFENNNMFALLSGSEELKEQMKKGWTEQEIRESWQKELEIFKEKRKKYLLYPDQK